MKNSESPFLLLGIFLLSYSNVFENITMHKRTGLTADNAGT